jgi:hypothetical protein
MSGGTITTNVTSGGTIAPNMTSGGTITTTIEAGPTISSNLVTGSVTTDYNVLTNKPDLSGYATTSSVTTGLAAKQATLVSGTNIKTINGTTLLGSGDLVVSGGSGDMVLASAQTNTGAKTFSAGTFIDKGTQVYNVKAYGATGNGSTDDGAAIASAITAANTAGGGVVFFPAGNYKVTSSSRTDTVSFASGSTFNDVSAVSGDVGKYVLWGNLGRVAKITSVVAGTSFTVDVVPTTTAATSARIVTPGIVIPEGVYLNGVGSNYNTQLTTAGAIGNVSTQISDAGTGTTILIRGANSPAGGSTRYGISNLSVVGNTGNKYGLFVGNGAWMIESYNAEFSSHGVAGIALDGNINSHNFHNTILYGNGAAAATTPTGGVVTHPFNAAGSASCNFYNTFFSANIGFGICDGLSTGGAYGVNLWAPQFNSQQASAMANSGTSMVLQSKGTGDGMATVVGGWSETAALYDVITSGYVTIIGMRMHSSHAYHWIVNGGIANAVSCTFEGASTATAQLNSSGIFNWNGIKVTTDPILYSGAPATIPPSGSSGTFFGNSLTANGVVNTGDFLVKDAATATKAMRFQTSGASLDVAFGGATNYISNWTGADFTGTQKFYMAFDTSGNFDAFQVWRWHTAPFGTTMMTVDSGNTTTPLQLHGGLSMDGATSGTTSLVPTAVAGTTTLTLPAATDTLVGKATTDTLTNKSLTSPTLTGTPGFSGSSGVLSIYANPDGGEYNIGASVSGKLALFGSSSATLDLNLLDGGLYTGGTLRMSNSGALSNVTLPISAITATGTPSSTTYLRGDGTWSTPTGSGSGIVRSVNTISSPTTAGATATTDYVYFVSGTTTLTLPTAVGNSNRYTVKNTGSATVTVATTSAQTIDGSATATLPVQYTSIDLISDGANWNVV